MSFAKSLKGRGLSLFWCMIFLSACASSDSNKINNDNATANTDAKKIYSLKINKLNDRIFYYYTTDAGVSNNTAYKMTTQDYNDIKNTLIHYANLWTDKNIDNTLTIVFKDNGERMIFQFSSGDNIEIMPHKFKTYYYNQYDTSKKEVSLIQNLDL